MAVNPVPAIARVPSGGETACEPPWYDSEWLRQYLGSKRTIQRVCPERLTDFIRTFDVLRTSPVFSTRRVSDVFDEATMARLRQTVRTLPAHTLELHEAKVFGRFVVHDNPIVAELHSSLVELMSSLVGEDVEPSYSFISLYSRCGRCPIHLDSPEAKWTLDLCLDQSALWPIHLSKVVPWPEDLLECDEKGEARLKHRPNVTFESVTLNPGEAAVFSGSSQWHYRNDIRTIGDNKFCNLVFFHFVPRGMKAKVKPRNWAEMFGIPQLAETVV